MSLVSALSEGTIVRNGDSYRRFVSFHSREASRGCRVPNVYHNSGQHLSQEAIFRARTKKKMDSINNSSRWFDICFFLTLKFLQIWLPLCQN